MNSNVATLPDTEFATLLPQLLFAPAAGSGRRACCKLTYPTKRDALTARNAAFHRRRHRPDYLRAYPCHKCNGWHLTHHSGHEDDN